MWKGLGELHEAYVYGMLMDQFFFSRSGGKQMISTLLPVFSHKSRVDTPL